MRFWILLSCSSYSFFHEHQVEQARTRLAELEEQVSFANTSSRSVPLHNMLKLRTRLMIYVMLTQGRSAYDFDPTPLIVQLRKHPECHRSGERAQAR